MIGAFVRKGSSAGFAVIRLSPSLFVCLATIVLAVPLLLSLLRSDRTFRIYPEFSVQWRETLASAVTWEALLRSSLLAAAAAAIGVAFVGAFLRMVRFHRAVAALLMFAYAIDPTIRARAYRYMSDEFASGVSASLLLDSIGSFAGPSVALALQYAPILLLLRLFDRNRPRTVVDNNVLARYVFVDTPRKFSRWPFEITLFFMAALFDPWLIRVVTGARANYWGPLLLQRALASRNLAAAATMLLVGTGVVVLVFLALRGLMHIADIAWLRLKPLSVAQFARAGAVAARVTGGIVGAIAIVAVVWPWGLLLAELLPTLGFAADVAVANEPRAITVTIALSAGAALLATLWALWLATITFGSSVRRLLGWSALILAIAPEAAFVMASAFLTATGKVRPSLALATFVVMSFTVPIAYLAWQGAISERERAKLLLPSFAARYRLLFATSAAVRQTLSLATGVALLTMWIVAEDVVLMDFTAGPVSKPFSAVMFASALRGVSPAEAFWAAVAGVCRFTGGLVLVWPAVGRSRRDEPDY